MPGAIDRVNQVYYNQLLDKIQLAQDFFVIAALYLGEFRVENKIACQQARSKGYNHIDEDKSGSFPG